MLPPPPKKPASFSMKKSSDYFQEKNLSRKHSILSNEASRQQKENYCNYVDEISFSSSSFNTKQKVTASDNTEFVQKVSKRPIESRTMNVDICNSTISNDMGMYIKKTFTNNTKLSFLYSIVLIDFDLY